MTTIRVTQDHIDRGLPVSAVSCPIVLAVRDSLPHSQSVSVSPDLIVYQDSRDEVAKFFKAPVECTKFVEDFDMGFAVQPFEFELDEPYRQVPLPKWTEGES